MLYCLSIAAGALIIAFNGDTHALVPLFAVGAFLAFTLSQAGMVLHWQHLRGGGWRSKAALNGLGAIAAGIALVVIGVSKFAQGARITIQVLPLMVLALVRIRVHYRQVADQLTMEGFPPPAQPTLGPRAVIPISGVHRAMSGAVEYARSISKDLTGVYVELEPGSGGASVNGGSAGGLMCRWSSCPHPTAPSSVRCSTSLT